MGLPSEILTNPQWKNGYATAQQGDRFQISFADQEAAIAYKECLAHQYIFPEAFILSPIKQILTYWQFEITTINWLDTDKKRLLEFDFSRNNLHNICSAK